MSKSIMTKAAALLCTATTAIALGVAAAAETTREYNKVTTDKPYISVERVTVDEADAKAGRIAVSVAINQAPENGWASIGATLSFDKTQLKPVMDDIDPSSPLYEFGKGAYKFQGPVSLSPDGSILGIPIFRATASNVDGEIITFYFDIIDPDAAPGKKYDLKFSLESLIDVDKNEIAIANPASSQTGKVESPEEYNGYIEIKGGTTTKPTTTSTTTTTTTTTTTSTTTTTTTTKTTTTTTKTTSKSTSTTTTTSTPKSTTSTTSTTKSGTTTTKTTTKGTTTTTKGGATTKSSTTTTAKAQQTGDAGVGLAVVALLTAAGTAVVATTKKKED